ncbi:putative GNL3L/Grn1 putative GTPase [Lyophyllum shimeji]|uniref:GNL3L/Grn1 putative GTPase n=1 Tax=Lyophyllum shimeji TaxID=47721 RepID=A0A9P3PDE9_LYOSH|nr:putative GNL3L/Grn1 putative GTPase [Lyophyllum shimeji]
MPRIRKKTSNRTSTNDRKKLQQKVRESRKKAKKAAKKNPQWKSKKPKDPGIPNNFPFKDQILAEISEQRRIEAEEKQRKKEEKKALRAKARDATGQEESDEGEKEDVAVELEQLKGLQVGNDAVGGLGAKQLRGAKTISRPRPVPVQEEEDEEVPVLINRDLPNLQAVLDQSDVIIQVLDARDPLPYRSSHLEELVATKPSRRILCVLNKIDTCPREAIAAWAAYLRSQHPTALFRSAAAFLPAGPEASVKAKGKEKPRADDGLGVDSILACLGEWAKAKKEDQPLAVAVVGIANVGKSSFINSLIRKNALPVYTVESSSRGPTTTELPQEVVVEAAGKQIRLIDTPGLSWQVDEGAQNREDVRARDILLRSKGRIDRLKDPTSVVASIVSRSSTEDLMLLYSLPAFIRGDSTSFLSGLARANQLVKKRGELDLLDASRILLRDWNTGKLARYTSPPESSSTTTTASSEDAALAKLYEAGKAILDALVPRTQLRKSSGLVKLVTGEVDTRKVFLDEPWLKEAEVTSDEDEDEDEEMEVNGSIGDGEEDDEDDADEEEDEEEEEDDEDEDEDEEEEVPPPPSRNQKRKLVNEPSTTPVRKKVAFAPDPKSSKQAGKAGASKGKAPEKPTTIKTKPLAPNPVTKHNSKPAGGKAQRRVANVGAGGKATTKGPDADGDTAYDFGKFF